MAQCHAERRKHASAMDFYVGALHSKLYSSNRDVDKYPHWPSHGSTVNSSCTRPSQSFCKEPSAGSGPSPCVHGSFRESTLMVGPSSEIKPLASWSYSAASVKAPQNKHADARILQPPTTLPHTGSDISRQHCDGNTTIKSISHSNGASTDKEIIGSTVKVSNIASIVVEKQDPFTSARGNMSDQSASTVKEIRPHSSDSVNLLVNGIVAGPHSSQAAITGEFWPKPTLATKLNCNEQGASFPRSHKSAELLAPLMNKGGLKAGNVDAGRRLYKSGEQIAPKLALNAGRLKESLTGGLIVGSHKGVVNCSGEALTSSGSPTATKDQPRWSSADSNGSVDLPLPIGGSPTGKCDGRKASSTSGSSDGGSPMVKDVQSDDAKDYNKRSCAGNVLNSKDAVTVRGMGNILVGANIQGTAKGKCTNNKMGGSDSKPGDDSYKKAEEPVPILNAAYVRGSVASNVCADGGINRSLGNLCHGNRNSGVPSSNILNNGFPRTHVKQIGETKNGLELLDAEDMKNAGNVQYKMGHFSEAVALYEKSIAMCPNHAPYRSNRAAALARIGRLGEAVLECEEAIKLDPQYERAHQRAAHLYLRLGLIESAKRHFQATTGKDDAGIAQALQGVERHISRSIEARKVGEWRSVLRESSAAIAAGADSAAQVLGYKSEALLKLHRLEEADALCAEAHRLEISLQKLGVAPADAFVPILRAHIEMYLGRFEGAIVAAEAAAKTDPRNMEAIGVLKKARAVTQTRTSGNELFKLGRFFEACAVYGEGLESDATNAVLLCNRAACRSKLGQWEKAIEDCDAALTAQPNYIKALMRRAHCSTKLERWEDALQDYEVLRVKMPSDMEVARGYFDVQVAIKKSRGEEIHKMKFGREVEEVYNEDQLREVVTVAGISVVQFITRWSDRCCQISPFIDKLCKRFPCVHFVKVDVEDNPHLAKVESVTLVPTFKIYRSGQRVKELQGPSEQALEHAVKHYSL